MEKALGRRTPVDWKHYEKFPLTASTVPDVPVPVVLGINWYTAFDNPQQDSKGRWWIGKDSRKLGSIRGGHCVALEPGDQIGSNGEVIRKLQDITGWWDFYDQGHEGACVGFGCSRMMSLLNRKRYYARWLWDFAKAGDAWSDTNPGDDNGTSVDSGLKVLSTRGHVIWKPSFEGQDFIERDTQNPTQAEGISVYRWAREVAQVMNVLKAPSQEQMGAVRILNSWGRSYPHKVWMPFETLQRLIDEDGEVGLVTDR